MFRKIFSFIFIIAFAITWYGCSSDKENGVGPTPPPPPPRLVVGTHQSPGLGSIDHAVWDSITAVDVSVGDSSKYNAGIGFTNSLTASMKALIANDSIFVRVEWNDNSEDNRFGELRARWMTSGQVEWELMDTTLLRNEDRFYIFFDNGGTNGANCASLCHTSTSSIGRRHYNTGNDNADVWHWKANRTGEGGFAEDMHITDTNILQDPQAQSNDSLYWGNAANLNSDSTFAQRAHKMHPDSSEFTGPALLEGIYVTFNQGISDTAWVPGIASGDSTGVTIPAFYHNQITSADGSRWDVRAVSEHDGTGWTVVFARHLTTMDADDVDLTFSTPDSVQISIAIGNNSGMKHHGAPPFYMVFE
ncbi:MAG: ethylbenzene dehydrogenase-related protein [Candidatus Zixiibacteriota bacterium]